MMRVVTVIFASQQSPEFDAASNEAWAGAGDDTIRADRTLSYAAGVKKAFELALSRGFTHAIILDVDRDHVIVDVGAMTAAARENPEAIISGVRQIGPTRLPLPVKLARANCDLWVWSATSHWITDSPHGFRAYPLAAVSELALRSTGFEFDVEILVKASWAGVKFFQIPVHVSDGKPTSSALMPPGQFVRYGWLTGSILLQRFLLPTPMLASMHRRPFGDLPWTQRVAQIARETVLHHCDYPATFAASIGLGVFFGISPFWGFQMILGATFAHLLRLSKPMVLAASNISFPITIPFILYASLLIGHVLHTGEWTGLPRPSEMSHSVLLRYLGEYVAGSLVLAIASGVFAAVLTYVAAVMLKSLQRRTA